MVALTLQLYTKKMKFLNHTHHTTGGSIYISLWSCEEYTVCSMHVPMLIRILHQVNNQLIDRIQQSWTLYRWQMLKIYFYYMQVWFPYIINPSWNGSRDNPFYKYINIYISWVTPWNSILKGDIKSPNLIQNLVSFHHKP